MGIRFLCPNGHKLNVKAFLAGKRGICPHCDAKFLVPTASGDQATAMDSMVAAEPNTEVLPETISAEPIPAGPPRSSPGPVVSPPPLAAPLAEEPPPNVGVDAPEVWYVRTASGDQFGPASIELMQDWVAEGRVAVDCWVWRTGWPEWKTGGQAITFLNGPPPKIRSPAPGQPLAPEALAGEVPSETPQGLQSELTGATLQYQSSRRSRQERARKVTFFLGGLVLLLLAVLVGVLIRNK